MLNVLSIPSDLTLRGDCRDRLPELDRGLFHTCVTSPPYWGLRSYLPSDHPDKAKEIGQEKTAGEYVEALVKAFREVRRVLRDDGTLWLNLGDCYAKKADARAGIKPKDLVGIPWRVALALQDDGWYLRSDIVWEKPNPMPESVEDRPTRAHEYLFLLAKSADYYYDHHAIKEPCVSGPSEIKKMLEGKDRLNENQKHFVDDKLHAANRFSKLGRKRAVGDGVLRNARSVWRIATVPYKNAHFATFPPKLAERCILAGTSEQCCAICDAPYTRVLGEKVAAEGRGSGNLERKLDTADERSRTGTHMGSSIPWNPSIRPTIGWDPTCQCVNFFGEVPAKVLDPFGGAYTVALVAKSLGRTSCMVELNNDFTDIGTARVFPTERRTA